MTKKVRLLSDGDDSFVIPIAAARLSEIIAAELDIHRQDFDDDDDDDDHDNNDDDDVITITITDRIPSPTLRKITQFLIRHATIEKMTPFEPPFASEEIRDIVGPTTWYADFITQGVEFDFLLDMVKAANFLGIPPLLKLAVLAVSIRIHGKSPAEIRPMFGIGNDLDDPDQKARVAAENEWVVRPADGMRSYIIGPRME